MPIAIVCQHCNKKFRAPDTAAGKRTRCPNCAQPIQIPVRPAADVAGDAMTELARALSEQVRPHSSADPFSEPIIDRPSPAALPPAGFELDPLRPAATAGLEPLRPTPATPVAAEPLWPAPTAAEPPRAGPSLAEPPRPAAAARPFSESGSSLNIDTGTHGSDTEEVIAVPPIGVVTPSGIPPLARTRLLAGYKWQRSVAKWVRIAGLALGGLSLAIGIVSMIFLAHEQELGRGLVIFFVMFILAFTLALGGLLVRHGLLLLADLSDSVRRQQVLLDDIGHRLK